MPFSDDIVEKAWERSGERCECTCKTHWHANRCNRIVFKDFRGARDKFYGWEARSTNGDYSDLSNCEILCINCYLVTEKS